MVGVYVASGVECGAGVTVDVTGKVIGNGGREDRDRAVSDRQIKSIHPVDVTSWTWRCSIPG